MSVVPLAACDSRLVAGVVVLKELVWWHFGHDSVDVIVFTFSTVLGSVTIKVLRVVTRGVDEL